MKLDDFLKFKKVRYINLDVKGLTKNKEYELLGVTDRSCIIINDYGFEIWASMDKFEPVLDESKFKVGDRVYNSFDVKIRIIDEINGDVVSFKDGGSCVARICVHATPENHALLSQLYPHIEFEAPPKELKGSDIARTMLEVCALFR